MCNPVTTERPGSLLAKGVHAGLEWEIVKNDLGFRCGYVRIPPGHPWHGKDYGDEALRDVDVHGGLTFAAADTHCGKGGADDAWWLGFDCGHAGDARDPALIATEIASALERACVSLPGYGGVIRSTDYVVGECLRLAAQAADAPARISGS